MRRPVSTCSRIARSARGEVAGGEGLDDAPMLRDEVRVAFDVPAADDLHHQVHRELAVEARQERVAARSIWNSWKAALAASHSSCEIAASVASRRSAKRSSRAVVDAADGELGREQLEREPYVVALGDRARGHGRDEVAAPRAYAQEALGHERVSA